MRSLAFVFALLLTPSITHAASGPRWTPADLSEFSDLVVTGIVVNVTSAWDRDVNAIYTYVTLNVTAVLKGELDTERITIKQLGGAVNGYVLSVVDQPTFDVAQEVLLYLEARPRDGTLYTSALWQGKWDIERGLHGQEIAVRRAPTVHASDEDRQELHDVRALAAASRSIASRITVDGNVVEADLPRASAGFNLLGPFRYLHVPAVDVQAGGQPGLSGGGFSLVQAAIQRWNTAGSSFRYAVGTNSAPPRCSTEMLNNGRVTITFMDPCGEMSNTGGTLAIAGSYYVLGEGGTSNGQAFERAVEGFVVNNDSPIALSYLTNYGCFEDVQTHELGHVLGLHHSSDPAALMYATIDNSCMAGARGLRSDDVQGLLFIYGRTAIVGSTVPTAPTQVDVVVEGTQLTVTWNDTSVGTPDVATSYRVDFRSGHVDGGPVVASLTQSARTLRMSIPPGVSGAYNVIVTGMNSAGAGAASPRRDFTIGPPTQMASCTAPPPAVRDLAGSVVNQFARVLWSASPGASRYLVQAGSSQGTADLFPLTDLGAATATGAAVPPGFSAWVRVMAANACGVSAPTDLLIQ